MGHMFYQSFAVKEESLEDYLELEDEQGDDISREYRWNLYTDSGLRALELRIDFERFLASDTLSPVEKEAVKKALNEDSLGQSERKALSRARKKIFHHLTSLARH